ncbi:MAG: hypothetical protein HYW23_01950 [Candidatus Aenigmarchaeota archaeon]|nr:hypothetical protein [Candidatus Aenigmarchaeota archaeon]
MDKKFVTIAIVVAIAVIVAVGVLYTTGILKFGSASSIKNTQEATQTVGQINNGVQDISSILTNIDKKLG